MTDRIDPVPSAASATRATTASEATAAGGPVAATRAASASEAAATTHPIRVLFVCTGNSARSILAEALLRQKGGSDFEVHSAGTEPKGIHPLTRRVLEEAHIPTDGLRSKSVEEYLGQRFDYVITVCDRARQVCPVFPGEHASLHWGYEDPAAVEGPEEVRLAAFRNVLLAMAERIGQFVTVARRARHEGRLARGG